MDHEFWHERWRRGEIGFHRPEVHWALELYWTRVSESSDPGAGVLVPLSGKSLDMVWLAEHGHRISGIELSRKAISEFFAEAGRVPETEVLTEPLEDWIRWSSGTIELFEGDFFAFTPGSSWPLFYDRAALIALPDPMRHSYLVKLRSLLADAACGLLVTLESASGRLDGPPFDVARAELDQAKGLEFELLERREMRAGGSTGSATGTRAVHECAWQVRAC